jgi:hypothetical protein
MILSGSAGLHRSPAGGKVFAHLPITFDLQL